jgi:hypothetical protein
MVERVLHGLLTWHLHGKRPDVDFLMWCLHCKGLMWQRANVTNYKMICKSKFCVIYWVSSMIKISSSNRNI